MNRKILALLTVVIFSLICLSMVWADNNTTNASESNEIEDVANYILAISITDNGIKFSDGFTGFCIDPEKNSITADDKFSLDSTTDSENAIKAAIIECYKANKENDIENVISKVINHDTRDDIAKKALSSTEKIGDSAVVEISNDTEATFSFELLKSASDDKSDCLAYTVSLKSIVSEDTLSAANDENSTENDTDSDAAQTANATNTTDEKTDEAPADEDNEKTENLQNNTKTNTSKTVTETDKTVVNKTNTVIVNENNTTIINQNNTKIINKTNETPKNATIQDTIMRTVGNPIFLLVIVIIIVGAVVAIMRRKG